MNDAELLQRQEELQREADEVVLDLALDRLLAELGTPVRVGSSALGLMVWRDLDVTVVVPQLSVERVGALGLRLASHPRVGELTLRNDTGSWNTDPAYPDGLYLGLRYRTLAGAGWKIDIWFVDEPDQQPDLEHVRTLPPRLTDAARLAILRIKEVWAGRPDYRSFDIYTAVLDSGVQTADEFESWRVGRVR
jgi:hypothetical protein